MTITDAQITLVKDSLADLRQQFDREPAFFYEALFRRAPDLREMFREDLTGQGMKFMSTLEVIVERLDDADTVDPQYTGLGRIHKSLGVTQGDFEPTGEALIETIRHALGDKFDAGVEAAWRAAYATVAANMIRRGEIPAD